MKNVSELMFGWCLTFDVVDICKVTNGQNLEEIITGTFAALQNSKYIAAAIGMWKVILNIFMPVKRHGFR